MRGLLCVAAVAAGLLVAGSSPLSAQTKGEGDPAKGATVSPRPKPGGPTVAPPRPPAGLVKPIERQKSAGTRTEEGQKSGSTRTGEGPTPRIPPAPNPKPRDPRTGPPAVPSPWAGPVLPPRLGGSRPPGGLTRRARRRTAAGEDWQTWWRFHRDAFTVRARVRADGGRSSREADVFLGRRRPLGRGKDRAPASRWAELRREVVAALSRGLADPNPAVRAEAALALGKAGDWREVPVLAALLGDTHGQVREAAALGLGLLEDPAAQAPLLHLLYATPEGRRLRGGRMPEDRLRAVAALALGLTAKDPRGRVREALEYVSGSPALPRVMRHWATLGLGLLRLEGPALEQAAWHLRRIIEQRRRYDDLQRAHAVTALGRLLRRGGQVDGRTLRGLARLAEAGRSLHVRRSAVWALVDLVEASPAGKAALPLLLRLRTKAPDAFARGLAAVAAGRLGGEAACLALARDLDRGRRLQRVYSAFGLGWLVRGLRGRTDAGAKAMRAYGRRHLRRAFLAERSLSQKAAYALALGIAADPRAGPLLHRSLRRTPDQTYRAYLSVALGMLDYRPALPDLVTLLVGTDYVPAVKEEIGRGVAMMGTEAVPHLLRALARVRSGFGARAVALALGLVGDARAVRPLLRLFQGRFATAVAREAAARALGVLGDPRPVPLLARLRAGHNYLAAEESLNRLLLR